MPKEKTVKGEMYRNEDKIKRKTRVDNLEDFYNFRMPYKDEAIHAKKSMKILRTVTISSFLPFLAVVFFFLSGIPSMLSWMGTQKRKRCRRISLSVYFLYFYLYTKRITNFNLARQTITTSMFQIVRFGACGESQSKTSILITLPSAPIHSFAMNMQPSKVIHTTALLIIQMSKCFQLKLSTPLMTTSTTQNHYFTYKQRKTYPNKKDNWNNASCLFLF